MSRLVLHCAVSWLGLLGALRPSSGSTHRPSRQLELIKAIAVSTAEQDFLEHDRLFAAALNWDNRKSLEEGGRTGSYLACADYGKGREALSELGNILDAQSVHRLSNSPSQGTCFLVGASTDKAATISKHLESNQLLNEFFRWPSVLKLAPGLLDHEAEPFGSARLATTYGHRMLRLNVLGLEVELSPGFLQGLESPSSFLRRLRRSLMSKSLNLHTASFWADSGEFDSIKGYQHSTPGVGKRARDWIKAADMVHHVASKDGLALAPGDVCSWNNLMLHQSSGTLILTGAMSCLLIVVARM